MILVSAALLFSGCSKKDGGNNPVTLPADEVTKTGTISTTEKWAEADRIYHVIGDCSIEAQVTWEKGIVVVVDPAAVISIGNNGVLTIEENVSVKLSDGAYIEAGGPSPGTLIATGSASAPIVFKANTGTQAWGRSSASRSGGIILGDSGNNSRLSYCTISGAVAGLYVRDGSPLITNCKISFCKGDGIYFDSTAGPSDSSTFTNDTISDCGGYPLTMPADKLGNFSGEVVFSGPKGDKSSIRVLGVAIEDEAAVWRKKALPYSFNGMTVIGSFTGGISSVTITPGVVCQFEPGACIKVGDPRFGSGTLVARGTQTDSIFFVNSPSGTVWGDSAGGIWIGPESPANSVLEYCSLQKATTGIVVFATTATISHCRVTGCTFNGMTFVNGGPVDSLAFLDNYLVGNAGYGMSIAADKFADLSGTGSVAGNVKGGIYVSGAEVWRSGVWKKHDAPYIVDGVLDIGNQGGVVITIHPGTEFDFLPGAYLRVGNLTPGTLVAVGSAGSPIVFASFVHGAYWGTGADSATGGGIRIEKNADANTELNNCTIKNATSGVYVNAKVKIQSCTFQDNQYFGLIRDINADPALISGNSFSGNDADSTYVAP